MSTTPPPQAQIDAPRPATTERTSDDGAFGWLRALGPRGRRAFTGAFGGYALDSYDYFTLPLSMVALSAYFGLNSGQTVSSPRSRWWSRRSAAPSRACWRTASAGCGP